MKKSQLNAISRSYAENNLEELINKTGMLYNLFEFQKQYKSLTSFLKAYKIDFQAILKTLEVRKEELEKVGCTSYKYGYVLKLIEYTNKKIEEREGK